MADNIRGNEETDKQAPDEGGRNLLAVTVADAGNRIVYFGNYRSRRERESGLPLIQCRSGHTSKTQDLTERQRPSFKPKAGERAGRADLRRDMEGSNRKEV